MFQNVIVGVDGGDGGRDAIALGALLTASDGRLTPAFVDNGDPRVWRGPGSPTDTPGLAQVHSPSIGEGLHELAEREGADLLVVGASRRGRVGRAFLGDDARETLTGAPCAVAIGPVGYGERRHSIVRLGVGYDGSPESEHALGVARDLASGLGATLVAFEAVAIPAVVMMAGAAPLGISTEELVDEARERLIELGDVEAHASYGPAGTELARFSGSVDLLIVGSRGYGPLGRVVHGSAATELTRSSQCPLLVLTRGAREREAA